MNVVVSSLRPAHPSRAKFVVDVFDWRPVWDLSRAVLPELGEFALDGRRDSELGHFNDGWGVCAAGAQLLGSTLIDELDTGRVDSMIDAFRQLLASAELVPCPACNATGVRTDKIGLVSGFDLVQLDAVQASVLGRTEGWCNLCDGVGSCDPPIWQYRLNIQTVQRWQKFVASSGGFTIT